MADLTLHLPWPNRHRPFVSLHITRWGYDVFRGRSRPIYHIGVGCGRLFTDKGAWCWFDIRGWWDRG